MDPSRRPILDMSAAASLVMLDRLLRGIGVRAPQYVTSLAAADIKYIQGGTQPEPLMRLEQRWYDSLEMGEPAYDVYGGLEYLADTWACWRVYSRKYLLSLLSDKALPGSMAHLLQNHIVVDLGNGLGFSTAALREVFPAAQVIGTNLPDTIQWKIASMMANDSGFRMVSDLGRVQTGRAGGLVFASEYFEHFYRPVEHLDEVLNTLRPEHLVIASTFNSPSIGHFKRYRVAGQDLPGIQTSRAFNGRLRERGYAKVPWQVWNNRPTVWAKT